MLQSRKWATVTVTLISLALGACGAEDASDGTETTEDGLQVGITPGRLWASRHGMTGAQFQTEVTERSSQGWRVTWVSGYAIGTQDRYAAIFEKGGGPIQVVKHAMTNAQYQTEFNAQINAGARLSLVNGYSVNNQALFVAIWEKKSGPLYIAKHGLSSAAYQTEVDKHKTDGFRLVHVSGYVVNGQDLYAAIWAQDGGPITRAHHGLTAAQHQTQFNTNVSAGFRMLVVSGYELGGVARYASVWEKGPVDPPWLSSHGVTPQVHQQRFQDSVYQGYRLVVVNGFSVGGQDRYNTVWQNFNYKQADLNAIDQAVTNVQSATSAPAISVAVTRDGRLVYAKAFGLADRANNIAATTASRFRIMSTSKSLTGAAVMKMLEENTALGLDNKVFGTGALLSTTFGKASLYTDGNSAFLKAITLRHLLNHRSGAWNGVNDVMVDIGKDGVDDTATFLQDYTMPKIVNFALNNRPITAAPGGNNALYSNFGYTLLGRIIEAQTGLSYFDYVTQKLLKPAGILGMSLGGRTRMDQQPNEVVYYHDSDARCSPTGTSPKTVRCPYDTYNVARMDAHGGWVATPVDLARFLVRVDNNANGPGDLITPTSWTAMTTPPVLVAPNQLARVYGFGWVNDGTPAPAVNFIWHNGGLEGTAAVVARTSDGFTLTALSNSWDNFTFGNPDTLKNMMNAIRTAPAAWPGVDLF